MKTSDLIEFPGGEILLSGIKDLEAGIISINALLVCIAAPRLRKCGIEIKSLPELEPARPYEHVLYDLLYSKNKQSAHGEYNALIRRLVSLENALELITAAH